MRILFIAHRIPFPPDKGDKIRSFHELQALAAAGHEVHLLAFAANARDRRAEYRTELLRTCARVGIHRLDRRTARVKALAALARGVPFTLGYFSSRAMRSAVQRKCASIRPHAIVVYSSSVAQYVPQAFH